MLHAPLRATPRSAATVPDEVKTELLQSIRKFLQVRRRMCFCVTLVVAGHVDKENFASPFCSSRPALRRKIAAATNYGAVASQCPVAITPALEQTRVLVFGT